MKIEIYETIISLYGCETWSLILGEEFRLNVFLKSILKGIFGPKRDKYGEWRSLHNEKPHSLYRSPNRVIIRSKRLRWVRHVARMEEGRSVFKMFTGMPTRKKPLGRPRRRWENNITMEYEEIGISTRNWVDSAQDRDCWRALVNAALNFRVP